jgi:hypothetical protein
MRWRRDFGVIPGAPIHRKMTLRTLASCTAMRGDHRFSSASGTMRFVGAGLQALRHLRDEIAVFQRRERRPKIKLSIWNGRRVSARMRRAGAPRPMKAGKTVSPWHHRGQENLELYGGIARLRHPVRHRPPRAGAAFMGVFTPASEGVPGCVCRRSVRGRRVRYQGPDGGK